MRSATSTRWAAGRSPRWPSRAFRRTGSTPTLQRDLPRRLRQAARSGRGAARRPHRPGSRRSSSATRHRRGRSRRAFSRTRARSPATCCILTKPIGTGIIATAMKFGRAPGGRDRRGRRIDAHAEPRRPPRRCSALPAGDVHACTDITGFGLIGHATEMAVASGVTLGSTPGACRSSRARGNSRGPPHRRSGQQPRALREGRRGGGRGRPRDLLWLLYDPQTSGRPARVAAARARDRASIARSRAPASRRRVSGGRPPRLESDRTRGAVRVLVPILS